MNYNCECFCNIDLFHDLVVEVFSVSKEEHRLKEDEEGSRQEGLVQAVEQGGCTTFKDLKMSNSPTKFLGDSTKKLERFSTYHDLMCL